MKTLQQFGTGQLEKANRNLRHAQNHRFGGLLVTEKKALRDIGEELERRAFSEYCKAHDC